MSKKYNELESNHKTLSKYQKEIYNVTRELVDEIEDVTYHYDNFNNQDDFDKTRDLMNKLISFVNRATYFSGGVGLAQIKKIKKPISVYLGEKEVIICNTPEEVTKLTADFCKENKISIKDLSFYWS